MNPNDFDAWLQNVPKTEPDETDLAMLAQAEAENDGTAITLGELMNELDEVKLSGRVNVRMPKSLQRTLIQNAKAEGVSLNQYVVYSLTRAVENAR